MKFGQFINYDGIRFFVEIREGGGVARATELEAGMTLGDMVSDPQRQRVYRWHHQYVAPALNDVGYNLLMTLDLCRRLAARVFGHYGLPAPRVELQQKPGGQWDRRAYMVTLSEDSLRWGHLLHEAAHGITEAADLHASDHGPLFVRCFSDLVVRHTPLTGRVLAIGRRQYDVGCARRFYLASATGKGVK